jgi:3-deoxy-D-manno-octulosonic-acid transferase
MILTLYRGLTTLGAPLISYYLHHRMVRGKEDRERFGERQGQPGRPRPAGQLVWLHAASVGEAVSMLPVIERLAALRVTVLLTTGTVTSARVMEQRLPPEALHQYVPVDRLPWVRRFLDHWRPDLALWAESEFWPNLLTEAAARRVPIVLLNGRVSDRSFARWQRQPGFIRQLLACFVLCLGQTDEDADRLKALGAARVACRGNLKFAAPPLPVEAATLAELTTRLGDRPRWLAASTHAGEEALAGRVHRALATAHPGLLTVIVPRHPHRGQAIAAELVGMGLSVARRAAGEPVTEQTDVLLADTMGELGLFVRLAPIVLMGKSLIGRGGQNPLEPARLGASVLMGPHMDNFLEMAGRMSRAGAAKQVQDEADLARALTHCLADPGLAAAAGEKALAFASAEDRILDDVMAELRPWLPEHAHACS